MTSLIHKGSDINGGLIVPGSRSEPEELGAISGVASTSGVSISTAPPTFFYSRTSAPGGGGGGGGGGAEAKETKESHEQQQQQRQQNPFSRILLRFPSKNEKLMFEVYSTVTRINAVVSQ